MKVMQLRSESLFLKVRSEILELLHEERQRG